MLNRGYHSSPIVKRVYRGVWVNRELTVCRSAVAPCIGKSCRCVTQPLDQGLKPGVVVDQERAHGYTQKLIPFRCLISPSFLHTQTPTNNIPKCKTTQPQPQHTQDLKAILTKPDKQLEEIQELINQNFEANNDQIGLLRELLRLEKGKREKAETINAIYEFVLSVEQIVCRRLNIEHSTLTRALRSDGTTWIDVRTLLNLEDDSSDGLLALIKHIKTSRLGHGRASPTTAKNLVLSKSLVPLAEENCSLTPKQVALLRKLLDWVVHDLSESATLADLRLAVEELMVLDSCLDSDLDSPLSESSLF
ncbi:hypothetical protein Pst134EA_017219 [Puccinia striiformis f. sp. tritici]|uniref:Uncharacterized protein n=1 Tax=Puccinia striiformis TaxID=27350 RepID=A0A2S4UTB2_9BASI|nr:hypothetical protein Pst134EA_017219 [Puccinia striiformis f. sp. tritici]KAH9450616.1 hypothetical protein Pst134EB_018146 [Puccinia striiformis f. sp. tritici]KAH9460907.1 hypothetical protein Pst134EA_017219 [Puccinia striiformis f. sp. tritici]POW00523.1 hypothetical protein PSTT_13084 [Puccinia striiformis]